MKEVSKIVYELLTNRNVTEGAHIIVVYVNDITGGIFAPFLLAVICIILTAGNYNHEKSLGVDDFPKSFAFGSFITFVFATLLKLIPGLVNNWVYGVTIAITTVSVLFFFFTKD